MLATLSLQAQWDTTATSLSTKKKVGIGVANPSAGKFEVRNTESTITRFMYYDNTTNPRLDIRGFPNEINLLTYGKGGASLSLGTTSAPDALYIQKKGNIGIGTRNPNTSLHILSYSPVMRLEYMQYGKPGQPVMPNTYWDISNLQGNLQFLKDNTLRVLFKTDGDVIFNTSLKINGEVFTQKLTVKNATWSDFVFDDTYSLMPLPELADYIQQHKHLPDLPTTEQIQQQGNDLAQTDALLLQKIEELTLYLLQLHEQVGKLQQQNTELTTQIQELKTQE